MAIDKHPLLRMSTESPSPSRQQHINRAMSLRAALLAFPLPEPSQLTRRHTHTARPSPLHSSNSNYTRLNRPPSTRLHSYQPRVVNPMPSSYAEISTVFTSTRH